MEWKHNGYTIKLDDMARFAVVELDRTFDTMTQAREAAEAAQKAVEKSSRKKLAIDVITDDTTPTKITGIHAGHGRLILAPKTESRMFGGTPILYVAADWIADALRKRQSLLDEAERIADAIEPFKIDYSPYRTGYRFDVSKIGESADALVAATNKQAALAAKTTLESALAKLDD